MSRQFWIRALLASLVLLPAAGCNGNPNPQPTVSTPQSASACPVPTGAPNNISDIAVTDPDTCNQAFIGDVARSARDHLQLNNRVKVVLPGTTYPCSRGGAPAPVDGSTTPALGYCDDNKVFIVTSTGVTQRINGTKIVYIWYVIANEAATGRFNEQPQQVCAAGYIVGKRTDANPEADLKLLQNVTLSGWPHPDTKPAQYIAYGQKLALDGKGIEACAYPMPWPAQPSASTIQR